MKSFHRWTFIVLRGGDFSTLQIGVHVFLPPKAATRAILAIARSSSFQWVSARKGYVLMRPLVQLLVASLDRCRVSDAVCQSGHPAIDGHRVTLVRTVRLGKPRAAGIELQRQSLVRPAIAERSLVGPHTELSGARSGRPEIPTHRDAPRPCLC